MERPGIAMPWPRAGERWKRDSLESFVECKRWFRKVGLSDAKNGLPAGSDTEEIQEQSWG